ncbi:N-acetylneuraminate synthase [Candidatus Ferrigenium straubiae]|uniref:N-acetylneuraminate synthase n=1 Tax=Candidatus Ferrigenium straubiae TaxID=2919506 RepID=UPI003F4AD12D
MNGKTFIIAEAGVNHNGDIGLAYQLIDAARKAGADAVKFQTFKTEKIVTRHADMADYQKENLAVSNSQFEMIKKLELSYDEFRELHTYCRRTGILFLSTPDEEDSLDFLADELDIPWLKIGSGEVNNYPFLRRAAFKQKPIILSTGMSTLGEVETAMRLIREINQKELVVLHCTTNYPCPMNEVNLRAMLTLKEAFKIRIGYSDHTIGLEVPVAAVALGAEVLEKHFTLDKEMEGPDHKASMDPGELSAMVRAIRNIESAMGDGIKRPNPSEEKTKQIVRKRLVAACDLHAGRRLSENDLIFKRANSGIFAEHFELVCNRILHTAVNADQPVEWDDIFGGH